MRQLAHRLPRILLIAEFAVVLSMLRDISYVTTHRLYIDRRVGDTTKSSAVERFDIEGARVLPQIAVRDTDRIAFRSTLAWPSTLHVDLRPAGSVRYEIRWHDGASTRQLTRGDTTVVTHISQPIPAGSGLVEFDTQGPLTWADPRLVSSLRITGRAIVLTLLAIVSIAMSCGGFPIVVGATTDRMLWFRRAAIVAGAAFGMLSLELGLRALGDRIPASIAAERHDLGEVRRDDRWEETRRYGRRFRARVDVVSEWRYGDIVRMGFIPQDISGSTMHRFRFQTDDEGFRNAHTRDRIDSAALGDSFTDAMTLDARESWTTLLERQTGVAVQNYGTAGFGPQQELRVLTDYAMRHRPRMVILAYFAGNDLFDAEAFDDFDRSGGEIRRAVPGWQIKDVVSRADTWFVVSAARAATAWASRQQRAEATTTSPLPAGTDAMVAATPSFDRGMFTLPVNGRPLRWAFMPAYLNTLNFSQADLAARRGWRLTRRALTEMRDAARGGGAELVVLFLPFKAQVYLPLLTASLPAQDLARALRFYLPDRPTPPDVSTLLQNRLAQNVMMRDFCAKEGIRMLDMTDALEARVRTGENVYYPDESHFNETGHALVAETLGQFLDRR